MVSVGQVTEEKRQRQDVLRQHPSWDADASDTVRKNIISGGYALGPDLGHDIIKSINEFFF